MGWRGAELSPGGHQWGRRWEKEDASHAETTNGFDVFISPGTTSFPRLRFPTPAAALRSSSFPLHAARVCKGGGVWGGMQHP